MVQIYGADDLEHSMSRVVKVRPKTMVWRAACGIATQSSDGNGWLYYTILALEEIPFIKNSNWVEAPG